MTREQFIMLSVYILAGLIGLCVGSFLNVVIYRVPNGMNLAKPDSHCTTCDYSLKWYDNIPVLSYIILGGKCRKCGQRISPRYMLVEIANCLLWLLSVYVFWEKNPVYAVVSALVCSVLICIFFIDLEHLLIFNRFLIILGALGAVAVFFDSYTVWYDHLIGAAAGGGLFLIIYGGAILVLHKEGMGFGDVKLALVAGLLLGWQKLLVAMLIASVLASVILMTVRRVRGDESGHEYPFGPFITVGMAVVMFFGEGILNWYVGLYW